MFFVNAETGASAMGGFYGDAAAAVAYLASGRPRSRSSEPPDVDVPANPEGEVWATTSLAVDGAFLDGLR